MNAYDLNTQRVLDELNERKDSDREPIEVEQLRARADQAYEALQLGAPPVRNPGEDLRIFRRRLLEPVRPFSPAWRSVNAGTVEKLSHDHLAFRNLENEVYADGIRVGMTPRKGQLRESVRQDTTGRRISSFIGDPAVTWAPFKSYSRHVIGVGKAKE